jgi:predicted Zn finger-like uncharacterized protein
LSPPRSAGENATVVVQCPTCQSKFRIADEKVTERGVRVRCTSCKNVFPVRKAGASSGDSTPGPGSTVDLSSLGASAISKPITGKQGGAARPSTGPVKPSTGPVKPSTGPVRPGASRAGSAAQQTDAGRLDVDDLFGMAELTGDAPLSGDLDPPAPPPPAPATKPAQVPVPSALADLDFDFDEPAPAKAARPPPPPEPAEPPEPPAGAAEESLDLSAPPRPAQASGASSDPTASLMLDDPFAQPVPPAPPDTAAAVADAMASPPESRPKSEPVAKAPAPAPAPPPPPPEGEIAPLRAVIASALTGLLGAALAVVVVIASAMSDDTAAGWLGFGSAAEVIATGVVSGLYDTAGGKPVFYVRGRVENRTARVRGPVRVTAELVADGAPGTKAEAIAGSEPSPEDVWSVRSPADADRLSRALQSAPVERKVRPGTSLPFFALISEPPADLAKHRLHLRIETVDAWTPAGAKAARDK